MVAACFEKGKPRRSQAGIYTTYAFLPNLTHLITMAQPCGFGLNDALDYNGAALWFWFKRTDLGSSRPETLIGEEVRCVRTSIDVISYGCIDRTANWGANMYKGDGL